MSNSGLTFFCSVCKDSSSEQVAEAQCTIEQSVRTYTKGEYIAYQGNKINHLYMLTKGRVKTEIVSDSGLTLSVDEITAPKPLAAAFLFASKNRFPVDVIALEECEVVLVAKEAVEKQMARCPNFLRSFMAFTADRMQFLSERLKMFSQKGIKAKVAYHILQHAKDGEFKFGRSIASLAEYFGVERPSLSRAISEMVHDGIIEFKAGRGRILNYNAIKELL